MPLDFRPSPGPRQGGRSRAARQLPHATQRKLVVLIGLLALVLLLMFEARKPQNWRWLWALQQVVDPAAERRPDPDTRLRPAEGDPAVEGEIEPIVRGSAASGAPPVAGDSPAQPAIQPGQRDDPRQQAALDAWRRLLEQLPDDQLQTLLRGLHAAGDQRPLSLEDRRVWPATLEQLDAGWQEYLTQARQVIDQEDSGLNDQERQQWSEILDQLETDWQDRFRPALAAVAEPPGDEAEAARAADFRDQLQALWDRVFLKNIVDNTVFRPSEKEIWFRLLDDLAGRDADQLHKASLGLVSFVQLYEQPGEYRGRLVTVSGTAQLVSYRPAPENLYGIAGYYVFWLRPVGANAPIVVYSLQIPQGFPDPRERAEREVAVEEDVEFTGYFFKRWAYQAQDGTRLAPLLLAKIPDWQPQPSVLADPASLPGPRFWSLLIGGTALFGIAIAACVYWFSRRSVRPRLPARAPHTDSPIPPP